MGATKYPDGVPIIEYAGGAHAIVEVYDNWFETLCVPECQWCSRDDFGVIPFSEGDRCAPLNKAGAAMLAIAKGIP